MSEQPIFDCIDCLETKPLTLFKKDPTMQRGRMRLCHVCYNKRYRKEKLIPPKIIHLPNEEWRFVSEYGNLYKISNRGRLMALNFKESGHPSIVNPPKNRGYFRYHFRGKNLLIHRLVAIHFIPNTDNKPQVNHINGIITDNTIENLEWCTSKENVIHAFATGLKDNFGENHSRTKLKNKDVTNIKILFKQGYTIEHILTLFPQTTKKALYKIRAGITWAKIKV